MSYKTKVQELYSMIYGGQLLEGFDKFYSENVSMQEPGEKPRLGKAINRTYEENFIGSISSINGGGIDGITADEDNGITMVESWMDVTFKDGNQVRLEQIARQKWEGEQIVEEKFYYNKG